MSGANAAAPAVLPDPLRQVADRDVIGALRWGLATYGGDLRIACSLSVEDCLLVDIAAELSRELAVTPTVFVLDTGRLHAESYETLERLRNAYRLPIQIYFPRHDLLEPLLATRGSFSFRESIEARKECCTIRKVEPLSRALHGAGAWVSGLRRAQSVTRSSLERIEIDSNSGLLKLSPLAWLSDAEVWALAESRGVVIHPLHRLGFPSIGCAPCTRAIRPGEDPRAGRWWWEDPEHKECGIHRR
jgi:phosphoadenosine phosphosulfate reductase